MDNRIDIVPWREVRDDFANLDTKLANIIDLVDPSDAYRFIKV
jgi:hypothetical protein